MESILVVEDSDPLRVALCEVLSQGGMAAHGAESAEQAIHFLSTQGVECILSDFKLPGLDGIELLKQLRGSHPELPFVLMTAYGSIEIAVQAMKAGANDFITKPFEPSRIVPMMKEVIRHHRILNRSSLGAKKASRSLSTKSPELQRILEQAKRVARVDSSVLLLGESGVGKELLARFIHENSPRHEKPFIAVNCGAIPAELLESEFFGHEAGAFTGATQARRGIFEVASEGTVFLDEVGEMPPLMQVKLLRALQEHEVRRVGGAHAVPVTPRIVAATNRPIDKALASGELREDFYFRLAVVTFSLPPLRRRREDIRPLVEHFMGRCGASFGRDDIAIDPLALDILESYSWPGNVRELENVIERAVLLADDEVRPEHLGIRVALDLSALDEVTRTLPEITACAVRRVEEEAIARALEIAHGNKTKAAQALGVSYKTLLLKVREYNLEPDRSSQGSS